MRHQDIARWVLALAGNRTRDVAQPGRRTFRLAREEGRADAATLRRFGLASSASASKAAANLVAEGVLVQEGPRNYRFDSPFQRGWVIRHAIPDLGIHLPPTHPVEL